MNCKMSSLKPKLISGIQFIPLGPEKVLLRSLTKEIALEGRGVAELLPELLTMLDGSLATEEILRAVLAERQEEAEGLLELLLDSRLLEDADSFKDSGLSLEEMLYYQRQISFFSHFTAPGFVCQKKLKQSRLILVGLGRVGAQVARTMALSGAGSLTLVDTNEVAREDTSPWGPYSQHHLGKRRAQVWAEHCAELNPHIEVQASPSSLPELEETLKMAERPDLLLFSPDTQVPKDYIAINKACLAHGITWTSIRAKGKFIYLGPTIIPFETACYGCLSLRLASNSLSYEEELTEEACMNAHPVEANYLNYLPATDSIIASLLSDEALRIITGYSPPSMLNKVLTFDVTRLETRSHPILKVPRCPDCTRLKTRPPTKKWYL